MSTSHFNLRNIPSDVLAALKREATKQKKSINSLILQIIEQRLGLVHLRKKTIFHDLDYLAGTWSETDKNILKILIKNFGHEAYSIRY